MSTIRDRVTLAIRRKGDTMKAVCLATDVKPQSLNKALNTGSTTYPHWESIAKYLDVPVDWLRNGGPEPWSNSNSVKENSVSYSVIKEEINEQTRRIDSLEHELTAMATRYIDLAEVAKRKGCDVPQSAIAAARAVIESNKPV